MTGNSSIIRKEMPAGRNQSARKHYGNALPYPRQVYSATTISRERFWPTAGLSTHTLK